jgi:hypothetical protein
MPNRLTIFALMFLCSSKLIAQKTSTAPQFSNDIKIADSTSTIMIPVLYNSNLFSSNKLSLFRDVYANVIFYNFITDSVHTLFDHNTYIENFTSYNFFTGERSKNKNVTERYIFYKVFNCDHDKNGRIDRNDPAILYISDTFGKNLKALTSENENVISTEIFKARNFILVKMQRDKNNDRDFDLDDDDYYYIKFDLRTLNFGNKIEL